MSIRPFFLSCALVVAAGCSAFSDADRAAYFKTCMGDWESKEFCTCSSDEFVQRFSWMEARQFAVHPEGTEEGRAKLQEIVKTCAARVKLTRWPKSGLEQIRKQCKGPPESCDCLERAMTKRVSFSELTQHLTAGDVEKDPAYKAALVEVGQECPMAFIAPDAPWPPGVVEKITDGCVQSSGAERSLCDCLSKRVSKKVTYSLLVQAGLGEAKAKQELEAASRDAGLECRSREAQAPTPRKHQRAGAR